MRKKIKTFDIILIVIMIIIAIVTIYPFLKCFSYFSK